MTLLVLGLLIGFCVGRAYDAIANQPKERVKK